MSMSESESFTEQVSRVRMMAEDDGETWDLSDNDKAALRAVLAKLAEPVGGASQELDEKLSQAQLVLRDGYHDDLSRAIANTRNLLTLTPPSELFAALEGLYALVRGECPSLLEDNIDASRAQVALDRYRSIVGGASPAPGWQDDYKALYHELLYEVVKKHPGESRHQTAKRYIREHETPSDHQAKAAGVSPPPEVE
jgi:hypothetical protein